MLLEKPKKNLWNSLKLADTIDGRRSFWQEYEQETHSFIFRKDKTCPECNSKTIIQLHIKEL